MKLPKVVLPSLLLMAGAMTIGQTEALRINIQPRSLIRPRIQSLSSLAFPTFDSVSDDMLMTSFLDDPFRLASLSPSSIANHLLGLPHRHHRRQCSHQKNLEQEAVESNKFLEQERELDRREAELKKDRELLEQQRKEEQNRVERNAQKQRLQEQIRLEREKIERREAWNREQNERRKMQEEEFAKREREWIEKKKKEKEMREQEEKARKEEAERKAREYQTLQLQRENERMREQMRRGSAGQEQRPRPPFEENKKKQRVKTTQPTYDIASLQVKGYNPEDISIVTRGNKMTIVGRHVCGCEENCFEREFQRVYTLPRGIDTQTLEGHIGKDGVLSVRGERNVGGNGHFTDLDIPVEGHRFSSRNLDSTCGGRKGGIKLKKMNKRTGEVFDGSVLIEENHDTFFGEENGDGITIEVIE